MGKRVDHDATQEVSASMLVPPGKPPAPNNDASMWLSAPVSADDFVGAAKKKPGAARGRGLVVGATVLGLLGVTAAGVYYVFLRETPTRSVPAQPVAVPAAIDAGAVVVVDAAVALPAVDASVPAPAAPLQVDAVSAADPAVKKATKKRPARKTIKKKPAAKRR